MAIRKTGSRLIVVDGVSYRWRIRRKPTYDQDVFGGRLTVAIELADQPGQTLQALGWAARPGNIVGRPSMTVTPRLVETAIRAALAAGWMPGRPGAAFVIDLPIPDVNEDPLNSPTV